MELDFQIGKPFSASGVSGPPQRKSRSTVIEYSLLAAVFLASMIPYVALFAYRPMVTSALVAFMAFFKVGLTFLSSTRTETSHHIRFLLAGSNPIGMTGGSSLLLGAVDSVLDWNEDSLARKRRPIRFAVTTLVNFLLTPIGAALMFCEFAWDVILLRRAPIIVKWKLYEFFSLARYHNIICPEKSNDIFYADMAFARYRNDPYHYQWVRMRSMVFELQHYKIDVDEGVGSADSNLFLQSDIEAYQVLKRLNLEEIESAIAAFYEKNPDAFLVPRKHTASLIRNARPVFHYLQMRRQLADQDRRFRSAGETQLREIAIELDELLRPTNNDPKGGPFSLWHLLRLMDTEKPSNYLPADWMKAFAKHRIVKIEPNGRWSLTDRFRERIVEIMDRHFTLTSKEEAAAKVVSQRPEVLCVEQQWYSPTSDSSRFSQHSSRR